MNLSDMVSKIDLGVHKHMEIEQEEKFGSFTPLTPRFTPK